MVEILHIEFGKNKIWKGFCHHIEKFGWGFTKGKRGHISAVVRSKTKHIWRVS